MDLSTIKETFGRVVYTHKTYEKAADIEEIKSKWQNWINIGLLVSSIGAIVLTPYISNQIVTVGGPFLAMFTLGFTLYQLTFKPETKAKQYRQTAVDLCAIRDKYIYLITDIKSKRLDDKEIVKRRDELATQLDIIYRYSIPTNEKAYKKAQKALQAEDEFTFNDGEVDQFLPKELR
jgi:hypothetical protein